MRIGSLRLDKGAVLAPMADYTNVAFRLLCKDYGSILQYSELISCKSIIYKNKKTALMLKTSDLEKPVFLQLFGNTPKDFSQAIKLVEKNFDNFSGYDLNVGCSVPKAIKGKYGSYLMNYPMLIKNILEEMRSSTNKPITIKMRLGFDKENFLEVADLINNNLVDAICLHARLGSQGFSGEANWKKIVELKKNIKIPVIGNGDIKTIDNYIEAKKISNVDAIMIGRGAIGNAFFFKQIQQFESDKKISVRKKEDIFLEGKKYLDYAKKFDLNTNDVRGYFIFLANGFSGAKTLRNNFALSKSINEIEQHFNNYFF